MANFSFETGEDFRNYCREEKIPIYEAMQRREEKLSNLSREEIRLEMLRNLIVMRESVEKGLTEKMESVSGLSGGAAAITTAAIILTGILANIFSTFLFRLFRIQEPVAKGVALGTAGHVVGTARANEIGPLVGAVSSMSLVTAGLLTAALWPLALMLVPA